MNIAQQTFGEYLTAAINAAQNAPMPPASVSSYHDYAKNFFAALDTHHAQVIEIEQDHRLTQDGKAEKYAALNASISRTLSGIASAWETNTEAYKGNVQRTLAAESPLDQGELANTRADAQMMLNNVEPNKALETMLSLATDDDPAMRNLMLRTPFPGRYLTSIGRASETALYDERKAPLMGTVLSEEGVKAHSSLDAATRLNDGRNYLQQALEVYVRWDRKPEATKKGLSLN